MHGRFPSASDFLRRQSRPRPRQGALAKAYATAVGRGSDARASGAPAEANPYREPNFHCAWREGWTLKDRELTR